MLEKLKGIKHMELILLVLAAGALLFAVSQPQAAATLADSQEQRLAQILAQVEGAGQVEVFLAYGAAQPESVYAFSSQQSSSKEVTGVIIVASGADDPDVKLRLMQAAKSALGVDAQNISVLKRKQEGS